MLKYVIGFFAVIILIVVITSPSDEELEAKKERETKDAQVATAKQNKIDAEYFDQNKDKIFIQLEAQIKEGNSFKAGVEAEKYLTSNDPKLISLYIKAKSHDILKELKTIPASEFGKNLNLYAKLLEIDPTNKKYTKKVKHYSIKVKEQNRKLEAEKQIAAKNQARKEFVEKQFSWDGSHRLLERAVIKSMNDPDSYEHDKTVYRDDGDTLYVETTFRGRNAFGGMIKNTIAATITLDGAILEIYEK